MGTRPRLLSHGLSRHERRAALRHERERNTENREHPQYDADVDEGLTDDPDGHRPRGDADEGVVSLPDHMERTDREERRTERGFLRIRQPGMYGFLRTVRQDGCTFRCMR